MRLDYLRGATTGAGGAMRAVGAIDAHLRALCDIDADASYAKSDAIMVAETLACSSHTARCWLAAKPRRRRQWIQPTQLREKKSDRHSNISVMRQ